MCAGETAPPTLQAPRPLPEGAPCGSFVRCDSVPVFGCSLWWRMVLCGPCLLYMRTSLRDRSSGNAPPGPAAREGAGFISTN